MKKFGAKILAMITAFAMVMPASVMSVMADGSDLFMIKAVDDFGDPVDASFEITDEDGETVWTGETSEGRRIDIPGMDDGTYTLKETKVDTDRYVSATIESYYVKITINDGEVVVTEANPTDYIWTVADNTITVVNRLKVTFSVEKVWDDDDDAAGVRPDEVKIKIQADNTEIGDNSATLDSEHDWVIDESGPMYTQTTKAEIEYIVGEVGVPAGYEATYSGSAEEGFVITNTYVGVNDEDDGNQTTIYEPHISVGESITLPIPDLYGNPYEVDESSLKTLDESIEVSTSETEYGNTAYTLKFTEAGTFKFDVSYTSKSDGTTYTLSYTVTVEEQTVEEEPEPDDGDDGDDDDGNDGDSDGSDTGDTDEPDESEPEDGTTKATITVQFLDVDAQKFEITISLTETTADGSVKIHEMLLNADNDWTASFEVDEDSTYSMTVEDIEGYEISLTGSVEDGFTVYIISADEEPQESEPDDSEPDESEPDDTEPDDSEPDESEPDGSEPDESEPDKSEPTDDGTSSNTGSDTDDSGNTGSGDTSSGSTESDDGSSDNISIITLPDGETIEVNEETDNVYEDVLLLLLGGTFEIKVDENAEVEIPDAFEVIERSRNTDGSMTYTLQANEVGEFVIIVTHEDGSKNIYYVTVTDDEDAEGVSEHITIDDLRSSSSGPGIVEEEDENEDSDSTTSLNMASDSSSDETSADGSNNNSDGTKEDTVETTDSVKTGMAVGFGALAALAVSAISGIAIEKKKRHD